MESTARLLAAQALAITSQDWVCLGFSDDPKVAPSDNVDTITERILALLSVRMVALLSTIDDFQDFSTSSICRTLLLDIQRWPDALTEEVIDEMRAYIKRIVQSYNDTPYHNRQHAYHVVLSVNKLLDLMLNSEVYMNDAQEVPAEASVNTVNSQILQQSKGASRIPKTYGLRRDALMQFAVVFAALIHDVQHDGISNRQLAIEDDPLSLLYNDTSTLEQQSLTIGFTELMQPEFSKFRKVAFPSRKEYTDFRKILINLVLATDIANPEKMQITKDKWKTAFGDVVTSTAAPPPPLTKPSSRRSIGSIFSDITVDVNAYGAAGLDEDEVSISEASGSFDGMGDASSSGRLGYDIAVAASSEGVAGRVNTPDSAPAGLGLEKIEESNKNDTDDINSQDLGYSTNKSSLNGSGHTPTNANTSRTARNFRGNRRGSNTSVPENGMAASARSNAFRRRRASIAAGQESQAKRFQRRLSSGSAYSTGDLSTKKFRQRLGITRSVDLTGEIIENYARKGSMRNASVGGNSMRTQNILLLEKYDEPDEMRASVILETLLVSADVAHNLQGWDHMIKWSHKLYWELVRANETGRGFDPSVGWYSNQIGFLEGYMLPLAHKLRDTGVFGSQIGPVFAQCVQRTLEMWKTYGASVTASLMRNRDFDPLRNGLAYADFVNQQNGNVLES